MSPSIFTTLSKIKALEIAVTENNPFIGKNSIAFKSKMSHHQNNDKYYNSTILLKTPHQNSNEAAIDSHNLSARTLEAGGSFNNLNSKISKGSK